MKKRNLEAERLADELLMAFGKELGEARADFCEALMDPERPDPPMFIDEEKEKFLQELRAEHDWDMDWDDLDDDDDWNLAPTPVSPRRHGSRRMLRRALILAATLILVMGLALVVAEGVKLKKSTMTMRATEQESTFLIDSEQAFYDVDEFRVTYVPEGYELVEDVVHNEFVREVKYHSKTKGGIRIFISKTGNFGANVDKEVAGRMEVLVNDNQAYLFDDGTKGVIVWQMGDCTIDVSARLSNEELKEIASHIFVN